MTRAQPWPAAFRALWLSATCARFGTRLGALSLTAIVYLKATPAEMGVLVAASTAPALVVALVAGVWVDRADRRDLLRAASFGRFFVLLTVPVAALVGSLTIELLYAVAFVEGCLEVLYLLANNSLLPAVVPSERLVEANARMRMTEATADSVSPAVGGAIVQAAGGPVAVTADALAHLGAGLGLLRMPALSAQPATGARPRLTDALQGIRTAVRDPVLRALLGLVCTYGFFASFLITLFALRVINELGLSPVALGLVAVAGGAGSVLGAGLVTPVTRRLGLGRTLVASYLLAVLCDLTVPLAGGPAWLAFAVLAAGQLLGDAFYTLENVSSLSLRQSATPPDQLGRVNAVFLFTNRSLRPLGAIAAGLAGQVFGIQAALFIGAFGIIAAAGWLFWSPLPRLRAVASPRA